MLYFGWRDLSFSVPPMPYPPRFRNFGAVNMSKNLIEREPILQADRPGEG